MKICYKALPNFKDVASELKLRYDTAVKVVITENNILVRNNSVSKKDLEHELIYSDNSVDKCGLTDIYVSNRVCSLAANAETNCKHVCCRGRYKRKKILVLLTCNCKFKWCCKVECDDCYIEREITVCTESS